jgi:hypothetical protein
MQQPLPSVHETNQTIALVGSRVENKGLITSGRQQQVVQLMLAVIIVIVPYSLLMPTRGRLLFARDFCVAILAGRADLNC